MAPLRRPEGVRWQLLRLGGRIFTGFGCSILALGAAQNEVECLFAAHRLAQRFAIFFLTIELGGTVAIASALRDDRRHAITKLFVIDLDFFLLGEGVDDQRRACALLGPRLQVFGILLDPFGGVLM